ncbi:MAG: diacylglycerol kinase [Desulfovibrio sp.]|nr:diacylglycerol kinase [Desulfovibrio sp.]MBI4961377.1 diacylglycerol kinase [Desulfovibrio sp.]
MNNKFISRIRSGYHPVRKIKVCLSGLRYAMRYDFSVAYKVYLSLVVIVVCFVMQQWVDSLLIILVTSLVLISELFNSAIESLCDFVEENENIKIKIIKDISAAAAGISIALWFLVLFVEMFRFLRYMLD